ncbi:hypothetical protein CEE55_09765, partial [Stenotrophomonas pavanii]
RGGGGGARRRLSRCPPPPPPPLAFWGAPPPPPPLPLQTDSNDAPTKPPDEPSPQDDPPPGRVRCSPPVRDAVRNEQEQRKGRPAGRRDPGPGRGCRAHPAALGR